MKFHVKPALLALCALALAASAAGAFPTVSGNTPQRARNCALADTIGIPAGPSGRSRTIYLVQSTTVQGEVDSVLNVWRNGGAVPAFRRIQGMLWSGGQDPATQASLMVTIYRDGATSARMKFELYPDVWVPLPVEADSIVASSTTAQAARLAYVAW